jgi:ACT domain-containing protein
MTMLVDTAKATVPFAALQKALEETGAARGLDIRIQREDIFDSMHRI